VKRRGCQSSLGALVQGNSLDGASLSAGSGIFIPICLIFPSLQISVITQVLLQATEKYATIEEIVYHLQMPAYMVKQRQRTRGDEAAVEGCVQAVSTRLGGDDRRSIGSVNTGRWLATCTLLAG